MNQQTVEQKINFLHASIGNHKKMTLREMKECGRLLTIEKQKRKGTYTKWLKENICFSERTAQQYMRVFQLSKTPLWDKTKSVKQNLAENSTASSYKQIVRQNKAVDLSNEKKIPFQKAKEIISAVNRIPEIGKAFSLSEKEESKIRLVVFEAMERAYDLGRRNRILTIKEKRDFADKITKEILQKTKSLSIVNG
ncbi:hypothetical protein [Leptospira phage LE4]|uniref:DUF3102 domain-containing protein n=1 Tax=Leptospira phage LE4 TaxID=2041383 RepID=A0A343LEC5_9CAUD|nr:hypothetical protein HWB34_gp22 [Leptospira phage LE4]ATN95035.1 hypothetical protein [Leptospira phage LE4]